MPDEPKPAENRVLVRPVPNGDVCVFSLDNIDGLSVGQTILVGNESATIEEIEPNGRLLVVKRGVNAGAIEAGTEVVVSGSE